jgi:hypothetical protein
MTNVDLLLTVPHRLLSTCPPCSRPPCSQFQHPAQKHRLPISASASSPFALHPPIHVPYPSCPSVWTVRALYTPLLVCPLVRLLSYAPLAPLPSVPHSVCPGHVQRVGAHVLLFLCTPFALLGSVDRGACTAGMHSGGRTLYPQLRHENGGHMDTEEAPPPRLSGMTQEPGSVPKPGIRGLSADPSTCVAPNAEGLGHFFPQDSACTTLCAR